MRKVYIKVIREELGDQAYAGNFSFKSGQWEEQIDLLTACSPQDNSVPRGRPRATARVRSSES
jgi:hypothetical protein